MGRGRRRHNLTPTVPVTSGDYRSVQDVHRLLQSCPEIAPYCQQPPEPQLVLAQALQAVPRCPPDQQLVSTSGSTGRIISTSKSTTPVPQTPEDLQVGVWLWTLSAGHHSGATNIVVAVEADGEASVTWQDEHGEQHRNDGPAWFDSDGCWQWYHHGDGHRTGGPTMFWPVKNPYVDTIYPGLLEWSLNGVPQSYLRQGVWMPAQLFPGGHATWLDANGQMHNPQGPAKIHPDKPPQYFISGEELTPAEFHHWQQRQHAAKQFATAGSGNTGNLRRELTRRR